MTIEKSHLRDCGPSHRLNNRPGKGRESRGQKLHHFATVRSHGVRRCCQTRSSRDTDRASKLISHEISTMEFSRGTNVRSKYTRTTTIFKRRSLTVFIWNNTNLPARVRGSLICIASFVFHNLTHESDESEGRTT